MLKCQEEIVLTIYLVDVLSLPRRKDNLEKMKIEETLVTLVDINESRTVPELGGQIHSTKGNGCCRLHTEQERCHWLGRVSEID